MPESKSQTNAISVAEELYTAVVEGGLDAMQSHFGGIVAEDFRWHPALIGTVEGTRTYVGRAGFAEYLEDFNTAFASAQFFSAEFEEIEPGRVLVAASMRVTGAGSGIPLDMDVAYVLDIENGRCVVGRSFFTRAEAEEFIARA
jgi:ketosteroid isomerase-like protein